MANFKIIKYLEDNNILWQPIKLTFAEEYSKKYEKNTMKKILEFVPEYGRRPDYTEDFPKPLDTDYERERKIKMLKERQKYVDKYDHIGIDTNEVAQLDIDFLNGKTYPDTQKFIDSHFKNAPYFKSALKEQGKHIFFKAKGPIKSRQVLYFETYPGNKDYDLEILAGQWSYCDKNMIVYNQKQPLKELDLTDYYKLTESEKATRNRNKSKEIFKIKKNQEKEKKKALLKKIREDNKIIKEIQKTEIKIEKVTNEVKANNAFINKEDEIEQIANNIAIKFLDDYEDWLKIVWSLANTDKKYYNLAKSISQKSKKYDEDKFNKTFYTEIINIHIGTLYYYSKLSNEDKHYEITLKHNDNLTNDDGLAEMFLKEMSFNLVYKNDLLYVCKDNIWYEDSTNKKLSLYIPNVLRPLIKKKTEIDNKTLNEVSLALNKHKNPETDFKLTDEEKTTAEAMQLRIMTKFEKILKLESNIGNTSKINSVAIRIVQLLQRYDFDEIEFDDNPYYLPFKNGVYDLKTFEFRDIKRQDYIIRRIKYKYNTVTEEQIDTFNVVLSQIFPDNPIKENYIRYLCNGLYGFNIEKFVIANGAGANGKGFLHELMEALLTDMYFYTAPNSILANPLKTGNNPEVANMNKKRMIVYREPEENKKINGSVIKELTGGNFINARQNYSNDTKTQLCAFHVLECNAKPLISGRVDNSLHRRLADIPFKSKFTDIEEELKRDDENVFRKNVEMKNKEYRDEFKLVLFEILIRYIKANPDFNPSNINDCDEVKERTKEYLEESDEFATWFNESYKRCEAADILKIQDIFTEYKAGDEYNNLSREEKKRFTKKSLFSYFQHSVLFKNSYILNKMIGNNRFRNCIKGYELRNPIAEENEEDEED